MASLIPSSVGQVLADTQQQVGGVGDIVTNVKDVVQTVGTVWDQLTGRSQTVEPQAATIPVKPAAVTASPGETEKQAPDYTGFALIGVVVLAAILVLRA